MIDVGELGFCLGAQPFVSKGDGRSITKAAHAGGQFVVVDRLRGLLHGFSSALPSQLTVSSRVAEDDDKTDDDEGSTYHAISRLFTAKVTAPSPSHLVRPGRGRFHGPFRTQQHRCRQIGWL
jgi:hypothetical protein